MCIYIRVVISRSKLISKCAGVSLRRAVDQDCCDIADEDGTSVAAASAYAGGVVVADSVCLQPPVFLENTDLLPGVFGITPKTDKQTNKQQQQQNPQI